MLCALKQNCLVCKFKIGFSSQVLLKPLKSLKLLVLKNGPQNDALLDLQIVWPQPLYRYRIDCILSYTWYFSEEKLKEEVLHFSTNCPDCNAPAQTNMKVSWFSFNKLEAEFKEFKPRLKYGWFHLKSYSMFQDLNRRSIETGFWAIWDRAQIH